MFNLVRDIRPISYIKSHTAEMIRQVGEKKNPVVITQNGEAKAVLIDVDTYQNLLDTINLTKIISIGENDFKKGRTLKHKEVDARVKKILE